MELAARKPNGWFSTLLLASALIAVLALRATPQLFSFGLTFTLVALSGYAALPVLRRLKAGQSIREDGPQSHLKKAGTPTMGGLFFMPWVVLVPYILTAGNWDVFAVSALTLACGGIGFADDWQIVRYRNNKGIAPRTKLGFLLGAGALFCLYHGISGHGTNVFGLGDLGFLFWPLALLALGGTTNGVNVTDGLDGLAAGTSAIASCALGLIVMPQHPELATVCFSLAGACLGFLVHNRHKASVFMGDTGSLAIGGTLAGVAVLSGQLVALALAGGVFTIETLSVIAQVSYYKATKGPDGKGKRLFRMAPLHHHFELGGLHETRVVKLFYLSGALLALFAVWLNPLLK
ncbi:MAG: phospho-N-acetylmuramoyl-pentapeptide-transferase [Anaerolineae bacterium]|nr:phospho-N-acetylmuramoyl-pentapeptide-transferase [Gloeobacterales cyanobacterium ES-bin-313]